MPLLQPYAGTVIWSISSVGDDSRFVQGWFDDHVAHLEIDTLLRQGTGSSLAADVVPNKAGGHELADRALAELDGWGLASPRQLRYNAFSNSSGILNAPGFGLAHEADPDPFPGEE